MDLPNTPNLPKGYSGLRINISYLSILGLILEIIGGLHLIFGLVVVTTSNNRSGDLYLGYNFIIFSFLFITAGKVLHYLRKNSIINYEILQHLKEQKEESKD